MGEDDDRPEADLRGRLAALEADNAALRARLEASERERDAIHRFLDTPAIAITHMRRDGTILMVNTAGARNMGGRPEDFEGRSMLDVFPALAGQTRARIERTLDSGQPLTVVTALALESGPRWFRSTYYPVHGPPGTADAVQLLSQDITELKRVERMLETTEGRLSTILEHAPQVVGVCDLDGRVRYINRVPSGYEMEQVLGSPVTDQLPPEHAEPFTRALSRLRQTGVPQLLEIDDFFGRHWSCGSRPSSRMARSARCWRSWRTSANGERRRSANASLRRRCCTPRSWKV